MHYEERLYEAWRNGTGCHLSAQEVQGLLCDDAIQTRITNTIATRNGFDEPGAASQDLWAVDGSVQKFLRSVREDNS